MRIVSVSRLTARLSTIKMTGVFLGSRLRNAGRLCLSSIFFILVFFGLFFLWGSKQEYK